MECAAQGDAAADCGPLDSGQFLTGGQQFGVKTDISPYKCHPSQNVKTDIPPQFRIIPLLKARFLVTWIVSMGGLQGSDVEARLQSSKRLSTRTAERPPKEQFFGKKMCLITCSDHVIKRKHGNLQFRSRLFQTFFFELGGTHFLSSMWAIFETSRK